LQPFLFEVVVLRPGILLLQGVVLLRACLVIHDFDAFFLCFIKSSFLKLKFDDILFKFRVQAIKKGLTQAEKAIQEIGQNYK
jgi:hypothetical protein